MIKILERYIAKVVILSTLLSTAIIIAVLLVISLLGELKSIGKGDYGLIEAFIFVFLRLPNQLYAFSPMLILLGSISALSILSSYRELAVMRASGFSIARIMLSVFGAGFLMILMIGIAGEGLGPTLSYKAEIRKENAQNAGEAVVTASGVWLHVNNNFIHVQHVIGRQLLEDVTRYQFDDQHRLQTAFYAKNLALVNHQWQMKDVVKTSFYEDRTKSEIVPSLNLDLKFNANLLNIGLVDPNEMSLTKLSNLAHYLERNGLQATEYRYELWRRILQPIASLIMVFLAIPFVLGATRQSNLGSRIVFGILVGFVFFILNALLGQICIVFQVPTFYAALCPLVLFSVLGMILTKSMIRR